MTKLFSYVLAALFAAASVNAFAMSHAGGAKDDKKMEEKKGDMKKDAKKKEMKKEEKKQEKK